MHQYIKASICRWNQLVNIPDLYHSGAGISLCTKQSTNNILIFKLAAPGGGCGSRGAEADLRGHQREAGHHNDGPHGSKHRQRGR